MKTIPLTQGKVTQVDDHWFEYLNQWKWYASKQNGRWYAGRSVSSPKKTRIAMHRVVAKTRDGLVTDHIDGDSLNNQECNLRICTHAENLRNRKIQKNNKSGFKGVRWSRRARKWVSQIKFNKRQFYLGAFDDPKAAALAYDEKAKELYGEFAKTNFVN